VIEILIFRIDQFSFWVGFAAGIIFAWVFAQVMKAMPAIMRAIGKQINLVRESLTTGNENRLRQDVLNYVQRQHLAAPLFSLTEIGIEARLMTPPLYLSDEDDIYQDITDLTLPYMPDWPEMAAQYGAPTLTLAQALENGMNIIVIGQPGSGKTVALAQLASDMARREPKLGELANMFPMFIPAAALLTHLDNKDPLDGLISSMAGCYISPMNQPRLKGLLKFLTANQRAMLLVDGLDELQPEAFQTISQYLALLKQKYPKLRLVAAASPENFNGLLQLGMVPLAMAAWNDSHRQEFVDRWQSLWEKFIAAEDIASAEFIDSLLLVRWLGGRDPGSTPLEITLRTWATFAGDILGPDALHLLDAHLRRLSPGYTNARQGLEVLAMEMVASQKTVIPQREAETIIARFIKVHTASPGQTPGELVEPGEEQQAAPENQGKSPEERSAKDKSTAPRAASASQLVSTFLSNGLLVSYGGSQIGFAHPVLMGYLAGTGIAKTPDQQIFSPVSDWTLQNIALGFAGCSSDIFPFVEDYLEAGRQTPIQRQSLLAARWLRITPKNASWRPFIMRYLLETIQKDHETLGLIGRAVSALTLSGDPGVPNLMRQLLKSPQINIRQMAALGCGMLGDPKALADLGNLTDDVAPSVMRAACLALVSIGSQQALDSVITVLLNGGEEIRRVAAEALTNDPHEGISIMQEGLEMEDILVRRAVIWGILRTKDPKMVLLLEKRAVEDGQWVVRNAAVQALEQARLPNPYIPKPEPAIYDRSWLINYAAESGLGVSDKQQAMNLMIQILERGEIPLRLKTLQYLRLQASEEVIPRLYNLYYGSHEQLREACFDTLWHMDSAGIALPSPIQFGLG
jgi:HEAT repeat protein